MKQKAQPNRLKDKGKFNCMKSKSKRPFTAKTPPVIGALKASVSAKRLKTLGEKNISKKINSRRKIKAKHPTFGSFSMFGRKEPVYKYTAHAFGYIPKAGAQGRKPVEIVDAGGGSIEADASLKNGLIKITLDRLRVFDYPGGGIHTILFDFYAQHQATAQETQDLRFTQKYRVQQNSGAGITGYPVFLGLKVGDQGVSFKCFTVNVDDEDDKKILGFLDGDVFKKGLSLLGTVNPVIPIVSGFATGIVDAFAHRNDNVPVQDFYMGLDFSGIQTRAQLREGSYIAVQIPDTDTWDWTAWIFNPMRGQIVDKETEKKSIPYNYIVFSISKM